MFDEKIVRQIIKNEETIKQLKKGKIFLSEDVVVTNDMNEFIQKWNEKVFVDEMGIIDELQLWSDPYNHEYYSFMTSICKHFDAIWNAIFDSKQELVYSRKSILSEISKIKTRLQNSVENDNIQNIEMMKNQRNHDMSTGIFESDEIQNRVFFNQFVRPYESQKTINLEKIYQSAHWRAYSYLYMKMEEILYFAYLFTFKNDKRIFWRNKYEAFKEMTFNKTGKEYDDIIQTLAYIGNKLKHQHGQMKFNYPIEKYFETIELFLDKMLDVSDIREFSSAFDNFKNEIEGIINPLGLTGFE